MRWPQKKIKGRIALDGTTPLTALPIPHIAVILEEIFALTPDEAALPGAVGDLGARAGLDHEEVLRRLRWAIRLSDGSGVGLEALTAGATVVDVRPVCERRLPAPAAAIDLFATEFAPFFSQERDRPVVFVCEDGRRSYSAALFWRHHGGEQAYYLEGGLQAIVPPA